MDLAIKKVYQRLHSGEKMTEVTLNKIPSVNCLYTVIDFNFQFQNSIAFYGGLNVLLIEIAVM